MNADDRDSTTPAKKRPGKNRLILHPFLFAVFPLLSVYFHNVGYVPAGELVVPSLLSLLVTSALLCALAYGLKDVKRAALIVSAFLLLFFAYGPVYFSFRSSTLLEVPTENEWMWLLGWSVLLGAIVTYLVRTRRDFSQFTTVLNLVSVLIVALPVTLGLYKRASMTQEEALDWREGGIESAERQIEAFADRPRDSSMKSSATPDIYYVILDAYGRGDILQSHFGLDNSPFLDELKAMGFHVAPKSHSNYVHTFMSLASSMNFSYIEDLYREIRPESERLEAQQGIGLQRARLLPFLKRRGYTIVSFDTGWLWSQLYDADLYLGPSVRVSEFDTAVMEMTAAAGLFRILGGGSDIAFDLHRERIIYMLEHLADVAALEEPTFTFAHVMAPHSPFVFGPDGEPRHPPGVFEMGEGHKLLDSEEGRDEYRRLYPNQVKGINGKVLAALRDILEKSPEPPVIIVHGDHGPLSRIDWEDAEASDVRERCAILNAIYLPGGDWNGYYDTISPVNIFRFVLNRYFEANLDLLEDRSYFSPWHFPLDLVDVTDRL